ncbi:MAG: FtsX-like permease family protein [Bacilli bacterium]|nr:FtsX-like permease family protein [Bacilli bacterium]
MLYKNTIKKIKKSFGRYASLFIIILVGVGFYSGIQAFAPNMKKHARAFYEKQNLMDFKIMSTVGLTEEDVSSLKKINSVKEVSPAYSLAVLSKEKTVRVHSIHSINQANLVEGRMPSEDNECLADAKNYKLGQTITVTSDVDHQLKNHTYKVVGTMESVLYVANDYGNVEVGDGKLDSFIFVKESNFVLPAYTEIYVTIKGKYSAYSSLYKNKIEQVKKELKEIKATREESHEKQLRDTARIEILKENPFLAQQPEMVEESLNKIQFPKVEWYIFDREVVHGYGQLELDIDVVQKVADVLPLFFIIIVVLMTSNTMNRMIVEERREMGTMSSLGYKNGSIINTYLLYVLSATFLGVTLGYFLGSYILPKMIYNVFPYRFPPLPLHYNLSVFLFLLIAALAMMTLVVLYSCFKELKQTPAKLFRPIPPKGGKKIFLENIHFLWKRTSFTWKITLRNMFRYKKRVLMTIIGVAGCTGLLLLGFGLKDSVNGIGNVQYSNIFKYDDMLVLKEETTSMQESLQKKLEAEKLIDPLLIKQTSYEAVDKNKKIDTYLVAIENEELFNKYYHFKDKKTNKAAHIKNDGAVITDKLANVLHIKVGDTITITSNANTYKIPVSQIVENYIMNYIFVDKKVYQKYIDQNLTYNMIISNNQGDKEKISTNLIKNGTAISVDFSEDLILKANSIIVGLDSIILLIIVVSAVLCFIVLYNLTSINISERTREVATIKVLGFTDGETNEYIYIETLLLTLIAIVCGLGLGILLHSYVINIIEIETVSYFKTIHLWSYIWAVLISFVFSIIMQVITYFKLRNVDMIESLKSVE